MRRLLRPVAGGFALVLALTLFPSPALAAQGDIQLLAGGLGWGRATNLGMHVVDMAVHDNHLYIADNLFKVVRKVDLTSGESVVIAGNGQQPDTITIHVINPVRAQVVHDSPEGLPALQASFQSVTGVAVASDGTVYLSDGSADEVYRIASGETIERVAGRRNSPSDVVTAQDGVPARNAALRSPSDLEIDTDGNLYILEPEANRVRKVDRQGNIYTLDGSKAPVGPNREPYLGDCTGYPAVPAPSPTSCELNRPSGIGLAPDGTLYVADSFNRRVVRVDADETITEIDGGFPYWPNDVAFTSDGTLLVLTDRELFELVGSELVVRHTFDDYYRSLTALAVGGNDRVFTTSTTYDPATGSLYDHLSVVFEVGDEGLTPIAGNGTDFGGDGGRATGAQLGPTTDIATDGQGNHYLLDAYSDLTRIWRVDCDGTITQVPVEMGTTWGRVLPDPTFAIAVAPDGALWRSGFDGLWRGSEMMVTREELGWVYRITGFVITAENEVIYVEGGGVYYKDLEIPGEPVQIAGYGTGANDEDTRLVRPHEVALDPEGNVFVADTRKNRIRRIEKVSDGIYGAQTTVAGGGSVSSPFALGDGGPAVEAHLLEPMGVAVAGDGSLLIADTGHGLIRRVDPDGTITTVAGRTDSLRATATVSLNETTKVSYDSGSGEDDGGYAGDGGPATAALLRGPQGVAAGPGGQILIADTGNNRARVVEGTSSTGCADPIVPTTLTYVGDTSAKGSQVRLAALLVDHTGMPVADRTIVFTFNGEVYEASTDTAGVASVIVTAENHGRSLAVTASFSGDDSYAPSSTGATIWWGNPRN